MVSFWPFKSDDSSAASFEKVLSQLSTKINNLSAQNDSFRTKQRRYKVLWTLYSTFAYILVAAILTLVTGYQRWSVPEYTAMAGSPVLIFGVRTALDAYYNYRLSHNQTSLNELVKQREAAISKLKSATKYDSTQQLLDKYGGGSPRQEQSSERPLKKRKSEGGDSKQSTPQGPRTGFAPPPTANIQRAPTAGPQGPPGQPRRNLSGIPPESATSPMQPSDEPSEEFAPNAFSMPSRPPPLMPQQLQQYHEGAKWYDRIFDVVLGEDETQAKNRIALICQSCRLVNGQAPPGARTLEDVGRWRCSSCQAWNGVESEEKRMLQRITGGDVEVRSPASPGSAGSEMVERKGASDESDGAVYEHEEEEAGDDEDEADAGAVAAPTANSTRSKARQRKKA